MRITGSASLAALRERAAEKILPGIPMISVGYGTCGIGNGADRIYARFAADIARRKADIRLKKTGCFGFCAREPLVTVHRPGAPALVLGDLQEKEIGGIVSALLSDKPSPLARRALCKIEEWDFRTARVEYGKGYPSVPRWNEIPFFKGQEKIVLRDSGLIDPEDIEEYIAVGGYSALARALGDMTPKGIIQEIKNSGLRGRGGAGFPTGKKWELMARAAGDIKYMICNADEGDPGAYMNRNEIESDPHMLIEGMAIGAYAMNVRQGFMYVRAEYPLAVERLEKALTQARARGLLGAGILGTSFDFDIQIVQGAGAFVCGEETALMTSIEGKRGMPRPRPPFPAVAGLWAKPSVLNNVETLANIGQIILRGSEWHASVGTEKSKGTKVFALTGDVNNVGLVEVPMGTTLGSIIYDIGGGIPGGKKFKAAQLGGPSGGCIPVEHLNAAVDYEKVAELGAIMGSGGLIVMNEDKCAVDMARFFMEFCKDESCGKCTPCREGTQRMLDILTNICKGKGREGDIELLESMATVIKDSALCGLGQTAPNPVLSTIRYFRKEYEEHIRDKKCRAAVCSALFRSPCQHTCPIGMDIPAYIALIRDDRLEDAYKVMMKTNPFPSVCGRVCDHQCQTKCRRGLLDEPVAIKFLKRYISDNAPRPQVKPVGITRREKIAVVGAGPAGLTCARDLALRGYGVTVFEELPAPGGMLSWGIPSYRLPRAVLDGEIDDIRKLGVEIRCNTRVGREIPWARIDEDFDCVYLAPGAHKSQRLGVEGEDLKGVWGGVEFLRDYNGDEEGWRTGKKSLGSRVAVIGGGNSAIDAARTALRLGAEVTILYRRLREDMPAAAEEILAAEHEGIKIEYLIAPLRVVGSSGRVTGVECLRQKLGDFDSSGRKRPVAIPGSEFTLSVDTVIAAIGQTPDLSFVPAESGVKVNKWSCFDVRDDIPSQTSSAKFFAGGDAVTGPSTVIKAIAAGHGAAEDIDGWIRKKNGEPAWVPPSEEQIHIPFVVDEDTEECPQARMPELEAEFRRKNFAEVELGYKKDQAVKEATRCLRCDAEI